MREKLVNNPTYSETTTYFDYITTKSRVVCLVIRENVQRTL